ncbi:MAG: hypothetical protein ACK521_07980 [bacterium]
MASSNNSGSKVPRTDRVTLDFPIRLNIMSNLYIRAEAHTSLRTGAASNKCRIDR